MIWGETDDAYSTRITTPHAWFAWHPVTLTDGRWAWLTTVQRTLEKCGIVSEISDGVRFFYRPLP